MYAENTDAWKFFALNCHNDSAAGINRNKIQFRWTRWKQQRTNAYDGIKRQVCGQYALDIISYQDPNGSVPLKLL